MSERRRHFGVYLAGLRRARGKSQRHLAALLCDASGTQSVTRTEISRWERGRRVPEVWLPWLAHLLAVPLQEMEQAAAYARGDEWARLPGPAASLSALLPEGDPLRATGAVGRRIGATEILDLANRVHALRLADDVLSGGDLINPTFRELRSALALYRESTFTEDTGRRLLAQIGELGQITGWVASDAGRLDDAEHAYRIGLDAARQAGDAPLAGNLAGSLAYQWSNNGREREGAELAEAALRESGPAAPAVARALFSDRAAWAHTRAGTPDSAQAAMRALGEAHAALDQETDEQAPPWAYWVSRAELKIMDARVFTELRRPLRAVPLLTDVLGGYDITHARELALYRSWLAVALADANEPEQAAAEAQRVIALAGDLSSDRTATRTRVVLERLKSFGSVPEVRSVLTEHERLLRT
ncbi:helix-turn-helix domain-containing protein [Streptomyces aureocirculatus]|uniref:helix-turn-helix domain-containing protein n=1 Tax=Streptomyces aureocirculatus TaxID=67275 RepID=UPI0004C79781|nr:helix-turn-helix transcriptional regulator [Streptomyces aureocirculatus]